MTSKKIVELKFSNTEVIDLSYFVLKEIEKDKDLDYKALYLKKGTFPNLKKINGFNCNFDEVYIDSDSLLEIDLSYNRIEKFKLNCPNLEYLNLNNNRIKIIESNRLNTPNLEVLMLAKNYIEHLKLSNFPKLRKVNLKGNNNLKKVEIDNYPNFVEVARDNFKRKRISCMRCESLERELLNIKKEVREKYWELESLIEEDREINRIIRMNYTN